MEAQVGYFSCHKIFFNVTVLALIILYFFSLHFHFLGSTKGAARVTFVTMRASVLRYIASIVSSWVLWWEGDLAIHHRNDAGDL